MPRRGIANQNKRSRRVKRKLSKPGLQINEERRLDDPMKNELQNLTEDISRLYEEITQKTESLGQIDSITRLYDELQMQLQSISTDEVDLLQTQIKSTLEQMVGISKSLAVIKTLKLTLNGNDEIAEHAQKIQANTAPRRSLEDR